MPHIHTFQPSKKNIAFAIINHRIDTVWIANNNIMPPKRAAIDSGIRHYVDPGDKLTCKCGKHYTFGSFANHTIGCEEWKKALVKHNSKMEKQQEKARKEAKRAKKTATSTDDRKKRKKPSEDDDSDEGNKKPAARESSESESEGDSESEVDNRDERRWILYKKAASKQPRRAREPKPRGRKEPPKRSTSSPVARRVAEEPPGPDRSSQSSTTAASQRKNMSMPAGVSRPPPSECPNCGSEHPDMVGPCRYPGCGITLCYKAGYEGGGEQLMDGCANECQLRPEDPAKGDCRIIMCASHRIYAMDHFVCRQCVHRGLEISDDYWC